MSNDSGNPTLEQLQQYNEEQLYSFFIAESVINEQIWILTDEYGCVMLNTDDEDCVPVWPSQELAQAWATEEWSECKPEAISLSVWHERWTPGLEEDGFAVVICPFESQDGIVTYAEELEKALQKKAAKLARK
ncbi:DUF2750 domain-containing protein [Neptuniibacter sp. QD37_6]|uniref:DUF2750 domain-containing protein n=1 Tax=Neptuniibacter sp. QD37_6 TaxID=3398210 RepID=UPI0039F5B852